MSGRQTYVLECDGCGCTAFCRDTPRALGDVRAHFKKAGWKHELVARRQGPSPSLDFCKGCVGNGVSKLVVERITKAMEPQKQETK